MRADYKSSFYHNSRWVQFVLIQSKYLAVCSHNWTSLIKHSASKRYPTADKQSFPVNSSSDKVLVSRKSHQHYQRVQELQTLELSSYLLVLLWLCIALSQNHLKFLSCLNPLSYSQDSVKTTQIKAANTANTGSTAWLCGIPCYC